MLTAMVADATASIKRHAQVFQRNRKGFRRCVLDEIVGKYACTEKYASEVYSRALRRVRAEDPGLVAMIPNCRGGRKRNRSAGAVPESSPSRQPLQRKAEFVELDEYKWDHLAEDAWDEVRTMRRKLAWDSFDS